MKDGANASSLASKRFRAYLVQKSHFTDKVTEAQDIKMIPNLVKVKVLVPHLVHLFATPRSPPDSSVRGIL